MWKIQIGRGEYLLLMQQIQESDTQMCLNLLLWILPPFQQNIYKYEFVILE